jgi:hypothetical protein
MGHTSCHGIAVPPAVTLNLLPMLPVYSVTYPAGSYPLNPSPWSGRGINSWSNVLLNNPSPWEADDKLR